MNEEYGNRSLEWVSRESIKFSWQNLVKKVTAKKIQNTLLPLPGTVTWHPRAIAWAEEREAEIIHNGVPLNATGVAVARSAGVVSPERIHLLIVHQLPLPEDAELRQAALLTGLLGPEMVGLTLGYGIYICRGHESIDLLAHECRHVYQYERAGSIGSFLPLYLQQIVTFGYKDAPFEVDARAQERQHT